MKKIIFTLLSFPVLFLSLSIPANARQAILTQISGTVEIQSKDSSFWRKAAPKMLLKDEEKIRTKKRSKATLLFRDGTTTILSADTLLSMSQLVAPVKIEQAYGKTRNKVSKLGKGFSLKTPTAVCSVRGTDFSVGVGEGGDTKLDVYEGVVNGLKTATGESMDVGMGQSLSFDGSVSPLGAPMPIELPREETSLGQMAKKEVGLDMTREQIQSAAAEEMKLAEYQEGKSMIDVNGYRVRLEEYILRKPKEVPDVDRDKAFKFVVLNTRDNRLDYFTYKGIFNKTLPPDLSIALRNVTGRQLGEEPEYYLTAYEMTQSNLTDALKDMSDGGHLVEVTYNGTDYTLNAYGVAADGKADRAIKDTVTQKGSANTKIYDPVADVYKHPSAPIDGIYNPADDTFTTMKQGETLWRTVFNRYGHLVGPAKELALLTLDNVPAGKLTQPWFQYYGIARVNNVATVKNIATLESVDNAGLTADGTFVTARGKNITLYSDQTIGNAGYKFLNGHYGFDSYFPDSADLDNPALSDGIHQRLITYYPKTLQDVPFEQYDTYIISDEGKISSISNFASVTSGKAFKEELIKWNYEQITRSSQFEGAANDAKSGRSIDLVVEPKILIKSGLIK